MTKGFNPLFFKTGPDMPVLKDLPRGIYQLKYAPYKAVGKGNQQFHRCIGPNSCGGWIPGSPLVQTEDDTELFKDGRRGKVIRCRRMGHEIAFFGVANIEAPKVEGIEKPDVQEKPSVRIQRGTGGIGS